MAGEVTTIQVTSPESTTIQIVDQEVSVLGITQDITILNAAPATISVATINLATDTPLDIARAGSVGVSNLAARADHVHSIANTLLDGGNY